MRSLIALAVSGVVVAGCSARPDTRLLSVADLPLTSTQLPAFSIEQAPLRANARYIMYDAQTAGARRLKVGDYYFVRWYDAHPEEPVRLVMYYTQAATGAAKLRRELRLDEPRRKRDVMMTPFFYTGKERARKGDVMTWKVELYSGGRLKDTQCSYLWRETPEYPVVPEDPEAAPANARGLPAESAAAGAEVPAEPAPAVTAG